MHVGIDVDGVLADNVPGLIPRIRQRHGVIITRAEISQWDYPVGNTHVEKFQHRGYHYPA